MRIHAIAGRRHSPALLALPFVLAALPVAAVAPAAVENPGHHVVRGDKVRVTNVIGDVTILPADGRDVTVDVTAAGKDAGRLRVEVSDCRGTTLFRVIYPSDRVVDPSMGRHSSGEIRLDECGRSRTIRFVPPGKGLDAHADLTIRVPLDQAISVELGRGRMEASKTHATLSLETGAGSLAARGIAGNTSLRTGSGAVAVDGAIGAVSIESGSGGVEARNIDGSLRLETGSGTVVLEKIRADAVSIETGSGGITAESVVAGIFRVETGSGGIEVTGLNSPSASLETGSGGVRVDLERSPESLHIDTGSGGVTLTAPKSLDASLDIGCSRQHLDIDFPILLESQSARHFRGRVGEGRGSIEISTGSGRVALRPRSG